MVDVSLKVSNLRLQTHNPEVNELNEQHTSTRMSLTVIPEDYPRISMYCPPYHCAHARSVCNNLTCPATAGFSTLTTATWRSAQRGCWQATLRPAKHHCQGHTLWFRGIVNSDMCRVGNKPTNDMPIWILQWHKCIVKCWAQWDAFMSIAFYENISYIYIMYIYILKYCVNGGGGY